MALAGVAGTNLAALLFASEATGNCFRCDVWNSSSEQFTFRTIQVLALDVSPQVFMLGINMALLTLVAWLLGRLPIVRQPGLHLSARQVRGVRELLRASMAAGLAEFATLAHSDTWGQAFNNQLLLANALVFVLSLCVAAWRVQAESTTQSRLLQGTGDAQHHAALPLAAGVQE